MHNPLRSPTSAPDPSRNALRQSNANWLLYTNPATTKCSTGSTVAVIRGPKIAYLDNTMVRKSSKVCLCM